MSDSLRPHHIIYGGYRFSDEYNSAAYRNIHATVGSTSRFVRTNSAITAKLQPIVIRKLECICNFHFANKTIINCKVTHSVYLHSRWTCIFAISISVRAKISKPLFHAMMCFIYLITSLPLEKL